MAPLNPSVRLSLSSDGKSLIYSTSKATANLWLAEGLDALVDGLRQLLALPLGAVVVPVGTGDGRAVGAVVVLDEVDAPGDEVARVGGLVAEAAGVDRVERRSVAAGQQDAAAQDRQSQAFPHVNSRCGEA